MPQHARSASPRSARYPPAGPAPDSYGHLVTGLGVPSGRSPSQLALAAR